MATIRTGLGKEYLDAYDGYDSQQVGIGLMQPDVYKTPGYSKKKIQSLAIGLLSSIVYSGYEHDQNPLILPILHESQYNTILAINLRYIPLLHRKAVMKFILESNAARIKSNQSIMIDYHSLKKSVPSIQYAVRRYKQVGIRVNETYQLNEIPQAINKRSRWENHYKLYESQANRKRKSR